MLIAIKRAEGKVSLMFLKKGKPPEEAVAKWAEASGEKALSWREVSENQVPISKNYRDAWTDDKDTQSIDIDLEKAKQVQKRLMISKMYDRTPKDDFGRQNTDKTEEEINNLPLGGARTLTELYNMWPASIDIRSKARDYKERK